MLQPNRKESASLGAFTQTLFDSMWTSYGDPTVFDPAIAPDENLYIRHHSGNHRIVVSGVFREDQGCNIKFTAREAAAN